MAKTQKQAVAANETVQVLNETRGEIYGLIDSAFAITNAHEALYTMLHTRDDDDMVFDPWARKGLGIITRLIGNMAFETAKKMEELAQTLEEKERKAQFSVTNLLQQEAGDE